MPAGAALREHWPEYLIEGWALGSFMLSAALVTTALESPASPLHAALPDATLRRVLTGIAMGLTAIAIIHSPWGKRSGAHMNPAVTLTFFSLGKVRRWDAVFFVLAQFVGGTAGVLLAAALLGMAFTAAPVSYVATQPGAQGSAVAFIAECLIAAGLMFTVLTVSNSRLARHTGLFAGALVAIYISVEGPYSGMSMNPARSFASAAPAMNWQHFWIYLTAPFIGMAGGAWLHRLMTTAADARSRVGCAKLLHPMDVRCIHCGNPGAPA
jgi:aquaporin Z